MPREVERYYKILKKPRVTEKGLQMAERRRAYPFEVSETANKVEIRQAVEAIFNVKVESVRTMNMLGKMRRLGRSWGRRPSWKKAIVTLKPGHAIEDFY